MKSTRTLLACFATGFALAQGQPVQSEPLPGGVVEILRLEKVVAARPGAQLSLAEEDKVLEACASRIAFVRAAAAYMLAYTESPKGTNALASLLSDSDEAVAGTARFSAIRRDLASLRDGELALNGAARMAKAKDVWTRVLLASWLGDRCGGAIASPFLAELRAETNSFVRAELLFQIGTHANKEQLEAARGALEQSGGGASTGFNEWEAQFLDAISANPLKRARTPGFLKRVIESRLAQEQ